MRCRPENSNIYLDLYIMYIFDALYKSHEIFRSGSEKNLFYLSISSTGKVGVHCSLSDVSPLMFGIQFLLPFPS